MSHNGPAETPPSVAVTIVTYNSAKYIRRCLEYVLSQNYPRTQAIVIDNASTDNTLAQMQPFEDRVAIVRNGRNEGFAGGQNQAIAASQADWILTLNPDVRLPSDFISKLVAAGETDAAIGTVCGKLLSMGADFEIPSNPVFDSTGIYMTPNFRHFDRGSKTTDDGRFDRPEFVFGATGAAALYRRKMIQDIGIQGEFFDNTFFAYREDADVAWRAQLLGWKCLYMPSAVAYHVRSVLPSNRNSNAAVINMHSVKNRFLMRIKNTTADLYLRCWLPVTWRDCLVIGGCLLREQSSLRAFAIVFDEFPKTLAKRRAIMKKRRVSNSDIARWFSHQPVSFPAPQPIAPEERTVHT